MVLGLLVKGLKVEDYKKDELRKEYGYRNYQDKGLPRNKEMNMSPQPYIRKKIQLQQI